MKENAIMEIYREFAGLYASGDYPQYSQHIAEYLPGLFTKLDFQPKTILDVACGEGTFAIEMAKQGYKVTGIDQSPEMLTLARRKARNEKIKLNLHKMDMRQIKFNKTFDLATSWFDSLNYILEINDLESTFEKIAQVLTDSGWFIFDMNTIYWLVTLAQRYACVLERDTTDIFQVHRHAYDYERRIASFNITGFVKDKGRWLRRIDETHKERGYTIDEIRRCLKAAGFNEVGCWSNLEKQFPFTPQSKRAYFVVKK
jgi:ubiquinone/menaquinone biosynthesis C-methylase UbiE